MVRYIVLLYLVFADLVVNQSIDYLLSNLSLGKLYHDNIVMLDKGIEDY